MPLHRPSLRSKSKSPAPPFEPDVNSRPVRNFLPPSHYAAAAGVAYPIPESLSRMDPEHDYSKHASPSQASLWPTSESSGNSFADYSSRTESRSSQHFSSSAQQSQMGSIPSLENQLLPSLKDTINKMTRPPSRGSRSASGASPAVSAQLSLPPGSGRSASALDFHTNSPYANDPSASFLSTPKGYDSAQRNTEASSSRVGTPRPKSVLKSALRSPMLKSSPALDANSAIPSMGDSSRSTNIPSGKSSTRNDPTEERRFGYRSRSCTDPGAAPQPKVPAMTTMGTPQLPSKSGSKLQNSSMTSSLPRFHGRSKLGDKPQRRGDKTDPYRDPYISTDESDLEYRYEMANRSRRRLVVANVDHLVVSSSSDSEAEGRRSRVPLPTERSRQGTPSIDPSATSGYHGSTSRNRPPVGLGFTLSARNGPAKRSSSIPRSSLKESQTRRQEESEVDDDNSVYDDGDEAEQISEPTVSRRSAESKPIDDLQVSHEKRRDVLLGIVSGLGLQPGHLDSSSERTNSDSEYQCLAISGSGDLPHDRMPDMYRAPGPQTTPKAAGHDLRRSIEKQNLACPRGSPGPSNQATGRVPRPAERSQSRSPVVKNVSSAPSFTSKRMSAFYVSSPSGHLATTPKAHRDGYQTPNRPAHNSTDHDDQGGDHNDAPSPTSEYEPEQQTSDLSSEEMSQSQSGGALSNADSELSTLGNHSSWQDDDYNELSVGAEALFKQISGKDGRLHGRKQPGSSNIPRPRKTFGQDANESRDTKKSSLATPTNFACSNSEASLYDGGHTTNAGNATKTTSPSTWDSDVPPEIYDVLLQRHGDQEIQRQRLIWEICETEKEYVARLRTIVTLFILPLRVKDSKAWIAGVPLELAKLLDWLDDIIQLHVQLQDAIQRSRTAQYPLVERFAETLIPFLPRLEVYQPYIVRLSDLTDLINQQVKDGTDLAGFIKMQEELPECKGRSFLQLLEDPINKLARYPSLFEKLLDVTPVVHSDYLATLTLRHSTDIMIRVMTEVKLREDEYTLTKDIAEQIRGLPDGLDLARRDRRLLMEGRLRLHPASANDTNLSTLTTKAASWEPAQRNSRLADAINDWGGARRARSGSTTSSSTGVSLNSFSSSSSAFPTTPVMDQHPPPVGINSMYPSTPSTKNQLLKSPVRPNWHAQGPIPRKETPQAELIHVFLLTDLILCVRPDRLGTSWTLLESAGLGRITGVREIPADGVGDGAMIEVDMVPLDAGSLSDNTYCSSNRVEMLVFSMPDREADHSMWISAFRKCQNFTIRALSVLTPFGSLRIPHRHDPPTATFESNMQALLASGLPIPKSPSVQLAAAKKGSAVSREREERGWWSLRFKQVLQEVQSGSDPYFIVAD